MLFDILTLSTLLFHLHGHYKRSSNNAWVVNTKVSVQMSAPSSVACTVFRVLLQCIYT